MTGENTSDHHLAVPAGDIGVGGREIGYLWWTTNALTNLMQIVLTGKPLGFGGSDPRSNWLWFGLLY